MSRTIESISVIEHSESNVHYLSSHRQRVSIATKSIEWSEKFQLFDSLPSSFPFLFVLRSIIDLKSRDKWKTWQSSPVVAKVWRLNVSDCERVTVAAWIHGPSVGWIEKEGVLVPHKLENWKIGKKEKFNKEMKVYADWKRFWEYDEEKRLICVLEMNWKSRKKGKKSLKWISWKLG